MRIRETSLDNAKQWPGPASSRGGVHQLAKSSLMRPALLQIREKGGTGLKNTGKKSEKST